MRPLANKKRAHLSLSHALWKLSACVPGLLLQAVPRHKVRSLCRLDQGVLVFLRERHTDRRGCVGKKCDNSNRFLLSNCMP